MSIGQAISSHIRAQARRLGFAGLLTVLSALSLYAHLDGRVGTLPAPLAVAMFYGAAVVLAGMVTTAILPRIRRLIEAVAVTRLTLAGCVLASPELGPQLAVSPFTTATLMVGGAVILLAGAPGLRALCAAPSAPMALRAAALAAERGARWLDNAPAPNPAPRAAAAV